MRPYTLLMLHQCLIPRWLYWFWARLPGAMIYLQLQSLQLASDTLIMVCNHIELSFDWLERKVKLDNSFQPSDTFLRQVGAEFWGILMGNNPRTARISGRGGKHSKLLTYPQLLEFLSRELSISAQLGSRSFMRKQQVTWYCSRSASWRLLLHTGRCPWWQELRVQGPNILALAYLIPPSYVLQISQLHGFFAQMEYFCKVLWVVLIF